LNFSVIATVFPLVFLAELPDKTMFASLLMASRGRPLAVWLGAVAAFAVHVVIAVSIGVAVFKLLPSRAVDAVVSLMFLAGAIYAFLARHDSVPADKVVNKSGWAVTTTAALVIFVAEWGDLTQILTANLAAKYHDWLSVAIGSFAALVAVAGLAVASGSRLLARLNVRTLRLVTAAVLLALAVYTAVEAAR
jgi:putative Ca2+/H+ antiporter (TMEM165/GDT1 family)